MQWESEVGTIDHEGEKGRKYCCGSKRKIILLFHARDISLRRNIVISTEEYLSEKKVAVPLV